MGMLEGAIIGAVVGIAGGAIALYKQTGGAKKVLDAYASGGREAARLELDKRFRPRDKIPLGDFQKQMDRMALLAIIGETQALEGELARHDGALTVVTQVNATGLLGLILRGPDSAGAAARLEGLSRKMDEEGGRAFGLVKKKMRNLAELGRALASRQPLTSDHQLAIMPLTRTPGAQGLLYKQALSVALKQTGLHEQANALAAQVRERTRAFET
jgi:hypothetical protein